MVTIVPETWVWYSITMCFVALRFVARYMFTGGIRGLTYEDFIMVFVICTYTVLIVMLNVVVDMNTNLIEPGDIPNLTPQDIAERTRGSKLVIVAEQMMCSTIWACKACLLLFYHRLTLSLKANRLCKFVGAYCAVTFVIMEAFYFGFWCRPFYEMWKTPTSNIQCATETHHLLVNLVFNLTSDVLILSIPLPLLLRSQLPLSRKLVLVFIFSLGGFVMLSAILSKVASFKNPFSSIWVNWYTRESSMAVIVTNMPHCWFLLRRVFHLKSFIAINLSASRLTRRTDRFETRGPEVFGSGKPPTMTIEARKNSSKKAVRSWASSKHNRSQGTNSSGSGVWHAPAKRPAMVSFKSTFSAKDQAPSYEHNIPLQIQQDREFIVKCEIDHTPQPARRLSIGSYTSSSYVPAFVTTALDAPPQSDNPELHQLTTTGDPAAEPSSSSRANPPTLHLTIPDSDSNPNADPEFSSAVFGISHPARPRTHTASTVSAPQSPNPNPLKIHWSAETSNTTGTSGTAGLGAGPVSPCPSSPDTSSQMSPLIKQRSHQEEFRRGHGGGGDGVGEGGLGIGRWDALDNV